MYKIQHFDRKICEGNSHCFDDCDVYSIWRFCPWRRWESLKAFLAPTTSSCCRPEWFPFIYWLALLISVMGFFYSCSEFLSIYYGSWTLSTFRDRKYRVIPLVFRRNVRLIAAAFMTRTWASLFIGIVSVTPSAIVSWLTIYFAVFCLELILWIGEILFGVIKLDFRSVCSHCMSFATYLMVRCVHEVFNRVIERRANVEELELLPKMLGIW